MARTTRKHKSVSSRRGPPQKKKRSTGAEKENRKDIAEKKPGKVNTNAVDATAKRTRRKKRNYAGDLEVELYRELDLYEINDRFEGRPTRVRQHYKTAHSFVVLKEDFDDNNGIAPTIWRINGRVTFMRERYVPHRETREKPRRNRKNLYIGTGKYDNWNPDSMWIEYYPVSVLYITPTRGHHGPGIVQFLSVE